jgi:hypothetical protein
MVRRSISLLGAATASGIAEAAALIPINITHLAVFRRPLFGDKRLTADLTRIRKSIAVARACSLSMKPRRVSRTRDEICLTAAAVIRY